MFRLSFTAPFLTSSHPTSLASASASHTSAGASPAASPAAQVENDLERLLRHARGKSCSYVCQCLGPFGGRAKPGGFRDTKGLAER